MSHSVAKTEYALHYRALIGALFTEMVLHVYTLLIVG